MWGIFLESVVIFKNYMGFHQHRYLAFLYLGILLYLWFAEKDRHRRAVFVYAPTLLLVMFFCPLFRKLFVRRSPQDRDGACLPADPVWRRLCV